MTKQNTNCYFLFVLVLTLLGVPAACSRQQSREPAGLTQLALLKNDVRTGLANGGWHYDRYESMEPLNAGSNITVADLQGPGIIKHIHTTRHRPAEVFARGIVLEIYFEGSDSQAVR